MKLIINYDFNILMLLKPVSEQSPKNKLKLYDKCLSSFFHVFLEFKMFAKFWQCGFHLFVSGF